MVVSQVADRVIKTMAWCRLIACSMNTLVVLQIVLASVANKTVFVSDAYSGVSSTGEILQVFASNVLGTLLCRPCFLNSCVVAIVSSAHS